MSIARTIHIREGSGSSLWLTTAEQEAISRRQANRYSAQLHFRDRSILYLDTYRGSIINGSGGTCDGWPKDFDEFMGKDKLYRIRCCFSKGGGQPNFYYHADVIAPSGRAALAAARDFRVTNWRSVDRFDSSDTAYEYFELLYEVEPESRKRPARPLETRPETMKDRVVVEQASYLQAGPRAVEEVDEHA